MSIAEGFRVHVCSDADGGLRLTVSGAPRPRDCRQLNEAIIAGLRSGVPRVEVNLPADGPTAGDVRRVLDAARSLARHLNIEFRVTGEGAEVSG